MKLFVSLVAVSIFTQASSQIQGLGPMKLGISTVSMIDSIAKANDVDIVESGSGKRLSATKYKDYMKIFFLRKEEIKKGEFDWQDYQYSIDPNVKTYFINKIDISGVRLSSVYLKFNNGVLYYITCDATKELTEALDAKYGQGSVRSKENDVTCRSNIAGEYKLTETTFTTSWATTAPRFSAEYILKKYYDTKCEAQYLSYFTLKDELIVKQVSSVENSLKDAEEKQAEARKKEALKDF
ncbi:MAG TPA: hypothetical protein VFR58_18130 [Flavisolibacter sp.]|nr:hypothetical protein [Flavisolibacter sp.]